MTGYRTEIVALRIGGVDYRVRTLSDRQQYHDPDGSAERAGISSATWPLFGMLWPAGLALAEEMTRIPIDGLRILEVGCGAGLSSLVLHKRGAAVVASDHHPLADEFLQQNAQLNALPPLPFHAAQWLGPNPGLGRFDLIVGSDVLYERDHPILLAGFIAAHAQPAARVMVADPGRGHRGRFSSLLHAQGFEKTEQPFTGAARASAPRGRIMIFNRATVAGPTNGSPAA